MKTNKLLLIFSSIFVLALCPTRAQNVILGYNPSYLNGSFESAFGNYTFASSFTVGAQDIQVTTAQFLLTVPPGLSGEANNTTAYIFTDSAGLPGATLGSSQRNFASGELYADTYNGGFTTYTFSSPLTLTAGDTYWAGFGYEGESGMVSLGFDNTIAGFNGYGAYALDEMSVSAYPPGGWSAVDPQTLVYQLDGSVVPEPSSLAMSLMGFGLILFIAWSRITRASRKSCFTHRGKFHS